MANKNALAKLGNAKTRIFVLAGGSIVIGLIIFAVLKISKDEEVPSGEASQTVGVPSSVKGIPGNATPEEYAKLQREENLKAAQEAEKNKGSAIATIIGQDKASGLPPGYYMGPDGKIYGPDGKPLPPGYYVGPDGKLYGPNGKLAVVGPDGLIITSSAANTLPPGYYIGPDGKIYGPDGKVVDLPPGYYIGPDGQIYGPDGKIHKLGPDGKLIELPPGYYVGPDGQIYGPDGKIYKVGPDGKLMLADQNGGGTKTIEQLRDERLKQQQAELDKRKREREQEKEIDRIRKLTEAENQKYQQTVQQRSQAMEAQAIALTSAWKAVSPQVYLLGKFANAEYEGQKGAKSSNGPNAPQTVQTSTTSVGPNSKTKKQVIKAGTIYFGVIDTAVNSDQIGPVLATIVGGKFQGARLIGSFEHANQAETVVINFKTLSLPKSTNSIGVNVVAIDPDTARTALASDVDHHYLLRYGTLFASSFVAGYGQAITQAGTVTTSPNGTTQTTTPELSGSQEFYAALGKVGQSWAAATQPMFNTPYTVTVDQGIGVGLLFLSDVDITPTES